MSTSAPDASPQAPQPLTEPGAPTKLQELLSVGKALDSSLLPTSNEIAYIVGALIYGDVLGPYVSELRSSGASDAEVAHAVSQVVSPPIEGATAQVIQGVDPAAYQAVQDEVAQLRAAVQELQGKGQAQQLPPASDPAAPAASGITSAVSPEQQELVELRALVDQLSAQVAADQHPTATSEAVPGEQPSTVGDVPLPEQASPTDATPSAGSQG